MNILLDYFFPITSITPTPEASTAFLKQVCVVVSPAVAVPTGVITLCTSMSQVAALTDNEEAEQLFDAGMSRVYILPMDDLDLEDALEGHEADFFTILISSDFTDEEITHSDASPAVAASKKIGDITFTAVTPGVAGNSISVRLLTGATAGLEFCSLSGTDITIHMSNGVSTANQIVAALNDSVVCSALVTGVVDPGDGAVAQASAALTLLLLGADAVVGSATGLQVGAFTGVVGVSSDDDTYLAVQAAIENRCAFHSTTENLAQNMFYAFGKMLSNALTWGNQQYITMPLADDVSNLGDAEALFEDKISFVIDDSEFGSRLGLFACGAKAITAPYIKRNLEIDLQSASLSYVSGNQPTYTKVNAALLEDEMQKVMQDYIDQQLIESGTVEVLLEESNFVASAYMNISEPNALWRIFGEIRQTL